MPPKKAKKIKPNAPCPCGSNKKYKKCCDGKKKSVKGKPPDDVVIQVVKKMDELFKKLEDQMLILSKNKQAFVDGDTLEEIHNILDWFVSFKIPLSNYVKDLNIIKNWLSIGEEISENIKISIDYIKKIIKSGITLEKAKLALANSGEMQKLCIDNTNYILSLINISQGEKTKPNEKCPCGSGKKYNKCCTKKKKGENKVDDRAIGVKVVAKSERERMYRVGVMYHLGQGVTKDLKKAVEYYEVAARQGEPGAQSNLGILYFTGQGVEKSEEKACELWRSAAEQGVESAIEMLQKLEEARARGGGSGETKGGMEDNVEDEINKEFQKALELSKIDPAKAARAVADEAEKRKKADLNAEKLTKELTAEEEIVRAEKAAADAIEEKRRKKEKDMVRLKKEEREAKEKKEEEEEEDRRDEQSKGDIAADQIKKEEEESKYQEQQQLMMDAAKLDRKERALEKKRLLADEEANKEAKEEEVNEEKKKLEVEKKVFSETEWARLAKTPPSEITSENKYKEREKYVRTVLSVLNFDEKVYRDSKMDGGPFSVFEREKPLLYNILKSLSIQYPDLIFVIVGGGAVQYYKETHKTSDLDIKVFKRNDRGDGRGDGYWVSDMRDRIYSFLETYISHHKTSDGIKLVERFICTRGMVFPKTSCDLLWKEVVEMFPATENPHLAHHQYHPDRIQRITHLSSTAFGDGKIPIKFSIKKESGPLKMVYSVDAQKPTQVMAPLMEFTFSTLDHPQYRKFGSDTPINVMTREELVLNLHQNFTKEPGLLKRIRDGDGTESIYPEKIFSWLRQERSLKDTSKYTSKGGGTRKKYRKKYKTRIKKRKRIKKSRKRTKKKHRRKKRKSRKKSREKSRKKSRKN